MIRPRSWTAVGLALLVGSWVIVAPAAGAGAAPISSCTSTVGTIVAVDFAHWAGPVVRGCDTSKPKNGAYLLTDEGFTLAGDQHDGPAFICRIGNQAFHGGTQYPTSAQDPCIVTPPASAYWSYWLAPAGQNTWSYSQLGAYSDVPKPGEVELWIFGGTNVAGSQGRPSCAPATLRAGGSAGSCSPVGAPSAKSSSASPTPKPRSSAATPNSTHPTTPAHGTSSGSTRSDPVAPSSTPAGPVARTSTAARPLSGTGKTTASSGLARAKAVAASQARAQPASAAPAAGQSATADPSAGQIVDAEPAVPSSNHGSAVPLVVGIVLAAVLGLAGGFAIWRRRQQSE